MTGEWWLSSDQLCYEEITYTMYTIAQVMTAWQAITLLACTPPPPGLIR